MSWWSDGLKVGMELLTLGTSWPKPRGPVIYHSGNIAFLRRDINGHTNEVEEQLWAMRNGLA